MKANQRKDPILYFIYQSNNMYKVLIIEDNKDIGEMFRIAFEERKFSVKISNDGLNGITVAVEFKPQIILVDIMMPQMDGFEFLKALKSNTSLDSKVIVISNMSQKKDEEKACKLGADYFLRKSDYTPYQIVDKVMDLLK